MQRSGTAWGSARTAPDALAADSLRAERVARVAQGEGRRLAASFGCAAALLFAAAGELSTWGCATWLLLSATSCAWSAGVLRSYCEGDGRAVHSARWERRFAASALVQGLFWGLAPVLLVPLGDAGWAALVLLEGGLVLGCALALAPLRTASWAWLAPLVPLALYCAARGGRSWPLVGAALLLLGGVQLAVARRWRAHEVQRDALAARNRELVDSLAASAREFEGAVQQLAALRDAALEAAEAKSAFLANMSHEIRTPMTSILGYADLLQDPASPEDARSYTAAIQRNAAHLLAVVNDILDLSKLEAGRMTVERIRFSPADVIGEAIALLEDRARRAGLVLSSAFYAPFPPQICCDPVRLRQILVNLVANAVKFTPQGGEICVESTAERRGDLGWLRVRVRDTGIGMSPEQLAQLFQPFAQADASTTRRFGGTGLGLSISRELAALLGGELGASSKLGQGSCFEVALPLGPWASLELAEPSRCVRAPWTERRRTGKQFLGRVLLAEDGCDNQRLISILLRRCGVQVDVVGDGAAALERARVARAEGQPHDLFLMDLQMPVLDGASAARALKADGFSAPVLVLTAQALHDAPAQLASSGFEGYVSKPIDRGTLERTLGRYLKPRAGSP